MTARRIIECVALSFLLVEAAPAWAESPPVWQGIWQGTIGTLPIRACLTKARYAGPRGLYYYLSQRKIIALAQQGDSKLWVEDSEDGGRTDQPSWTFDVVGEDRLNGTWRAPGKTLPLRLTRIANGRDGDELCSSMAFNGSRITPVRIVSKSAVKDGVTYTRLAYNPGPQFDVEVESFALPGSSAGISRVNALLRKVLPSGTGINDYLECTFNGLSRSGSGGNYDLAIAPAMITRNWLATEASEDTECGGTHPNGGVYPDVYDLKTGIKVDPLDWFTPKAVKHDRQPSYTATTLTAAFRAFIMQSSGPIDPECAPSLAAADFWSAGLRRTGMTFTPSLSHAEQPCAEAIVVPFARLARWLNGNGKASLASVVADLKTR